MVVPRENTTLKTPRDRLIYSGTEARHVLYPGAVQSGFRIIYFIYYSMNCSTTGWGRNGGRGGGGGRYLRNFVLFLSNQATILESLFSGNYSS